MVWLGLGDQESMISADTYLEVAALMAITKIVVVLALMIGGLMAADRYGVFDRAGVTGSCDVIRAPISDKPEAQWWECKEGILTGYPSLIKDHCVLRTATGGHQIWRCPSAIERPAAII